MNETPFPEQEPQGSGQPEGAFTPPAPYTPDPQNIPPYDAYSQYGEYGSAQNIPTPVARRRRMRWWIAPLVVGGVALVLAGGFIAGTVITNANAAGGNPVTALFSTHPRFGHDGPGHGRGGYGVPGRMGALTVSSVSGQTITAKATDGTTVTVHVSSSTQYYRADKQVNLSAVTKGENIVAMGQRNSDGSINAARVMIVLPGYAGVVTAVNGSDITISDGQATHVIHTSSSTTFQSDRQTSSLSKVAKGDRVEAVGTKNADGSLNAEAVEIEMPHAGGQVTSVSGSTITVTTPRGTETIHVSSSTQYDTVTFGTSGPSKTASSLSAIKSGDFIMAEGTQNSDGSLNASTVVIGGPRAGAQGHPPFGAPQNGSGNPPGTAQ